MSTDCENLDAYLLDQLPKEQLARFEHHLLDCASCTGTIRQQHWIDQLLRSPARLQLEPTPIHLMSLSDRAALQRTRRVQLTACAIAASVLVAVGLVAFTMSPNNV